MILFLDFDGVICTARMAQATGETGVIAGLDPIALAFLNRMCSEHTLQVVISSTWRIGQNRLFFRRLFASGGYHHLAQSLHKTWATPQSSKYRGDDIEMWLDANPGTENYIILDDDDRVKDYQKPRLIQTHPINGMLWEHYTEFEEKLTGSCEPLEAAR
jgi:hypothetical protein